ncbi:YcfL family protein [Opitutus sp. ER46]|uniref:DUF1425 domain-containing protein n=1 Tax=Opitutus sp. ER46 TaxID=2161864 RepID=UPI000D3280AA|nr:YcfL family protein [Opitutus sp. ER46]PTX98515.1 hypothetical protein DB354_04425 [Opitutus sp. ER46]
MKFVPHLILAATALGLAGCYSVNTVQNANPAAQRRVIADSRVTWDNTLDGKLGVGAIIDTTGTKDLRSIQVDVSNLYAYALNFSYKIEWFNRQGELLDSPTGGWKSLHLEAHETSVIKEIALSPAAVDFRIKFQEGKGSNTIF